MSGSTPYTLVQEKNFTLLRLFGRLGPESAPSFEVEANGLIDATPQPMVINCERLTELCQPWLRALLQTAKKLKDNGQGLRLVGASPEVIAYLKKQGVEDSLPVSPNLRAGLKELGVAPAVTLDVNFINPFLTAVLDVLRIQASTAASAGQIFKKAPSEKFAGDISGVIGIVSDAFTGSVVISFPAETFLGIMSRMLGEQYTELTKEIEDGAGELTNIVFGKAKADLNEKGYGIQTAIPSVITGKEHSVQPVSQGPRVVVPFETDIGGFFIEICISDQP